MLCATCRRRIPRGAAACRACGASVRGAGGADDRLELQLDDGSRVAVTELLTIGRAPGNDLQLVDPSVSRNHARVVTGGPGGPRLEEVQASHGTWVDDERVDLSTPLRDGARIRLGNRELVAVRSSGNGRGSADGSREATAAGAGTIVVPVGASLLVPAVGGASLTDGTDEHAGRRPRLRSGHRVKRVDAHGGAGTAHAGARWIVEDLRSGDVLWLDDVDGALLLLLDGERDLPTLVSLSIAEAGPEGPARLARLLADLGERGLLSGVPPGRRKPEATGWRRLVQPRELATTRLAGVFDRLYRAGGWLLFTRPAAVLLAIVALAGFVAEIVLIAGRYGSPLIVASHLGLGGLIFLAARGALVALHEAAHGLALASYGRRARRGGLRLVVVFPFAFVDTSEAWFEPRRHRLAITLAGPASDLVLGGAFAIACLALPAGSPRDVLFQVAFAAYVGALFNLNPFLDRDGYHVLVDLLGRPRLRERARTELARRLSGEGAVDRDPALRRFALAGLGWSIVAAGIAIAMSLIYAPILRAYVPDAVVQALLITLWVALFVPVVVTVGGPLLTRWRRP